MAAAKPPAGAAHWRRAVRVSVPSAGDIEDDRRLGPSSGCHHHSAHVGGYTPGRDLAPRPAARAQPLADGAAVMGLGRGAAVHASCCRGHLPVPSWRLCQHGRSPDSIVGYGSQTPLPPNKRYTPRTSRTWRTVAAAQHDQPVGARQWVPPVGHWAGGGPPRLSHVAPPVPPRLAPTAGRGAPRRP